MHVWLLAIIGVLSFLLLADKSRWKEMLPSMLFMIYFRFTSQYILVDICEIWTYDNLGTPFTKVMNIPVLVDLFFYPAMGYLYLQWYPSTRSARLIYAAAWAAVLTANEQLAVWSGTIVMRKDWHPFLSYLYFLVLLTLLLAQYRLYNMRRQTERL